MPYQLVNALDDFVADLCNLFKCRLNAPSEKSAVYIRGRLCSYKCSGALQFMSPKNDVLKIKVLVSESQF